MAADVWLPLPPDRLSDLPGGYDYRYWNGQPDFPADPADCVFYTVPYMKGPQVAVRPLAEMRRVRAVQTLTAGVEHMLPAVGGMPAGAVLCNAAGVHDASTAELALTLTLASLRGIPEFVRDQERGWWNSTVRTSLADRRALIVGYGGIGAAIEERLLPFEVAAVDRVARSARTAPRGPVHALSALPELLPRADVVMLAVPLTEETRGLVGAEFLGRMKDGALLVNVARGQVVDGKALLAELTAERLRAALDVLDPEPLPADDPLWQAPGILITPHVGGASSAFLPRAERLLAEQLHRFAAAEPLRHVVATSS